MTETNKPKLMNIRDFMDEGFLQEANRRFFHPLGLALTVARDDAEGVIFLYGIQDHRDDPEGMLFYEEDLDYEKYYTVEKLRRSKLEARINEGCDSKGIQPAPKKETETDG